MYAASRREADEEHYKSEWRFREPVLRERCELLGSIKLKHPNVDLSDSRALAKLDPVLSRKLDQVEDKLSEFDVSDWDEPDDLDLAFYHAFECFPRFKYVGEAEIGMRAVLQDPKSPGIPFQLESGLRARLLSPSPVLCINELVEETLRTELLTAYLRWARVPLPPYWS